MGGWLAVAKMLDSQGQRELAAHVTRFVDRMPPPAPSKSRLRFVRRRDPARQTIITAGIRDRHQ